MHSSRCTSSILEASFSILSRYLATAGVGSTRAWICQKQTAQRASGTSCVASAVIRVPPKGAQEMHVAGRTTPPTSASRLLLWDNTRPGYCRRIQSLRRKASITTTTRSPVPPHRVHHSRMDLMQNTQKFVVTLGALGRLSTSLRSLRSASSKNEMALPLVPARAVRPTRCR